MSNKAEIARLDEINEFLESIPMLNAPEAVRQWVEEQKARNYEEINKLEDIDKWEDAKKWPERMAEWDKKYEESFTCYSDV